MVNTSIFDLGTERGRKAQETLSQYENELEGLKRKLKAHKGETGNGHFRKRMQETREKIIDLIRKHGELNTKLTY